MNFSNALIFWLHGIWMDGQKWLHRCMPKLCFTVWCWIFYNCRISYLLSAESSLVFFPSREARCCSRASRRLLGACRRKRLFKISIRTSLKGTHSHGQTHLHTLTHSIQFQQIITGACFKLLVRGVQAKDRQAQKKREKNTNSKERKWHAHWKIQASNAWQTHEVTDVTQVLDHDIKLFTLAFGTSNWGFFENFLCWVANLATTFLWAIYSDLGFVSFENNYLNYNRKHNRSQISKHRMCMLALKNTHTCTASFKWEQMLAQAQSSWLVKRAGALCQVSRTDNPCINCSYGLRVR